MGFLDGLWRGREPEFDSGSAATNSIQLTKRHSQVSLTRQGAATGHLRINLSWRMRTSDIQGIQRESLLRHPFKALKPPEVVAHSQSMVNVDLDLVGCKRFVKITATVTLTGGTTPASTNAYAVALGDAQITPV